MNTDTFKNALPVAVMLAGLYASAEVSAASDPYVGATVTAGAKFFTRICSTCPIDSSHFPNLVDGGPGHLTADVAHGEPGYTVAGHAALGGPLELPTLGASVFADILIDPSIPKTFFYASSVTAQGLQRYTYTGLTAESFQLDYVIDGSFMLGSADAASLMDVIGGINVYKDGYLPGAEVNPSYGFDFKQASASVAGNSNFALSGSVDFTLEPGASFYVLALLSVGADTAHQIIGAVDALHTMTLSFSAGDTSLLSAEPTAVPLPPTLWLLAPLVAGLGCSRRRIGMPSQ